jgi:glycosyltransferase involved in cell wall biosynthesis
LGTYATNLADGLADAGHEVTVVCPEEANRESVHQKVRLITLPKTRFDPSHGQWFTLSYKFSKLLPKLLEHDHFHLIHFTDAREALFCPKIKPPVVGTANDCYFAEAPTNPFFFRHHYHDWFRRFLYYWAVKRLEPRAFGKLKGIIVTSRYVKESLIRSYGLSAASMELIYYGFRAEPSKASTQPPKSPADEVRILFVGSNFQRKGLPTVIRALPQVLARVPTARLYVIGKDPNEEAIRQLCGRMKIEHRVNFLGWQSHGAVREHFSRAALFVMPSLIENFAFVYLEAMAAGVPVIGSNVGGTRELIRDGVNGFLVKPLDVRDLAHKICVVLENKSLREQLVSQGYQTVKRFTLTQMIEETIAYYEKIIR